MARRGTRPALTPDQQAESDRIFAALQQAAADDLRVLADALAKKDDTNTFGATEFTLRDAVLRVAAKAQAWWYTRPTAATLPRSRRWTAAASFPRFPSFPRPRPRSRRRPRPPTRPAP